MTIQTKLRQNCGQRIDEQCDAGQRVECLCSNTILELLVYNISNIFKDSISI